MAVLILFRNRHFSAGFPCLIVEKNRVVPEWPLPSRFAGNASVDLFATRLELLAHRIVYRDDSDESRGSFFVRDVLHHLQKFSVSVCIGSHCIPRALYTRRTAESRSEERRVGKE